jgi:hypothetical protein
LQGTYLHCHISDEGRDHAEAAWLEATQVKDRLTHHVYVTRHIQKALDIEEGMGCFWCPIGHKLPDWVSKAFPKEIQGIADFGFGQIVWGTKEDLVELARLHPVDVAPALRSKRGRR